MKTFLLTFLCCLGALVLPAPELKATDAYPSRSITFIVPWGPGGGADQLARISSRLIEAELKVSVPWRDSRPDRGGIPSPGA